MLAKVRNKPTGHVLKPLSLVYVVLRYAQKKAIAIVFNMISAWTSILVESISNILKNSYDKPINKLFLS